MPRMTVMHGVGSGGHHPSHQPTHQPSFKDHNLKGDESSYLSRSASLADGTRDVSQDFAMERAHALLESQKDKTEAEIVVQVGVPQDVYLRYLKHELDNEQACMELPLTILMLLSFSMLALFTLNQDKVHAIEESIEYDIEENANFAFSHYMGHKGLPDVNSVADFWSWTRLGLIPLLVQHSWAYSELYPEGLGAPPHTGTNYTYDPGQLPQTWLFPGYEKPAPVTNDYLRYNRIIGGIRMQQETAPKEKDYCRIPDSGDLATLQAWLGRPCTPTSVGELSPELEQAESIANPLRVQWLLPEVDTYAELDQTLLDMESGCLGQVATNRPISACRCDYCAAKHLEGARQPWLTAETERVEIAFVVYNAQYGIYSYIGANFWFNRGGAIMTFINAMSAWADPTSQPIGSQFVQYLAYTTWVCSLLYVVVNESLEIRNIVRASREKWYHSIKHDYIGIWNVVDWVSIFVGIYIIQSFIQMRVAVSQVNVLLEETMQAKSQLPDLGSADLTQRAEYQLIAESFFQNMLSMCDAERRFRIVLCAYPSIVMLRLFKSFAAQPRLALVTATLVHAAQDLMHFFIVFFSVYICMTVNSILFFGQDLEEFSTLSRAIHTCFLAMFGDWDWHAMQDVGQFRAMLWFWSFSWLMVLILLNMLLAIIMESYTAEKEKVADAQTLIQQINQMRRRRKQFKANERVRLNDIWDHFVNKSEGDEKAMMRVTTLLRVEDLTLHVPGLRPDQAKRTMKEALLHQKRMEELHITEQAKLDYIKDTFDSVKKRFETIEEDAAYVMNTISYYDRMSVQGDAEFDAVFGTGNVASEDLSSRLSSAITELSTELGSVFLENMSQVEQWQDGFEGRQNELHKLLSEMQLMAAQQARCVGGMTELVGQLEAMEAQQAGAMQLPMGDQS